MEGAIKDYNKALSIDSIYTDALYNRAFAFKFIGDYTNAMKDAEQIISIVPESAEHWNLKGNIHQLFGEYNEAIDSYTEAININSTYFDAYYNRGLTYIMSSRTRTGCSDIQYCIDNNFQKAIKVQQNFCGW